MKKRRKNESMSEQQKYGYVDFSDLLKLVQEDITKKHGDIFANKERVRTQLRSYIEVFLKQNNQYRVKEYKTDEELIDDLYNEMAEYSILTPFLTTLKEEVEEINVNSWDDIAVIDRFGKTKKLKKTFGSPERAMDVAKRLLSTSGVTLDKSVPIAQSQIGSDIRVACLLAPIVDEDVGVAMSIRILHPQTLDKQSMIKSDFCTDEEMRFLQMCLNHGVSMLIAGATGSGKTTLMNILLESIPNDERIYTIESGARELSLVRRDARSKRIKNNVIHTKEKPSNAENSNITQEKLVVYSLRFDPKVICVGEIRDSEAYNAVESILTGHTGIATVHSGPGKQSHIRTGLLCMKKQKIDYGIAVMQAAQAFPIVVFVNKLQDNSRKIMDISECYYDDEGKPHYRRLYGYNVDSNEMDEEGNITTIGEHVKVSTMSRSLREKLIQYGVDRTTLNSFCESEPHISETDSEEEFYKKLTEAEEMKKETSEQSIEEYTNLREGLLKKNSEKELEFGEYSLDSFFGEDDF